MMGTKADKPLSYTLDAARFQALTLCSPEAAAKWAPKIEAVMDRFDIDVNALRVTMFLAQMTHESDGWRRFEENLNYSAMGLAQTWPNRYAVDPKAVVKVPNIAAQALNRQPQQIANQTYANRMGNGPPASGDGWMFRGRGPKQITGRDNYTAFGRYAGIDCVAVPDLLLDLHYGAMSAGWYWWKNGCNDLADKNDFRGVTFAINGAYVGLLERTVCLGQCQRVYKAI